MRIPGTELVKREFCKTMRTKFENPTAEDGKVRRRESESFHAPATRPIALPTRPLTHLPTVRLRGWVAILACFVFMTAHAEISEPDNVVYGTITLGSTAITAAHTDVVVEVRRLINAPAIARYRMGDNPQAGNFYLLRLKLESVAPLLDPDASSGGDSLFIVVTDSTGVRAQNSYLIGERGQFHRLDFGAAVSDSDGDGLPDAWEAHYFGSLSQNGGSLGANGLSALQNFVAGTNPNDPNSGFKLNIALNGNQKAVSFTALRAEGPGYDGLTRTYSLEASPAIAPASWSGVSGFTDVAGNNQTVTYQTAGSSAPAFFRGKITLQPLNSPANDSDGDGLPDTWETLHFGNLNQSAASISPNGQTALQSFTAGNNPNDPNSVFKLNVSLSSGQKVISFQALRAEGTGYEGQNRFYTLQANTSLAAGSWTDVPGFIRVAGNNQTVIHQATGASPVFYRANVWLETP